MIIIGGGVGGLLTALGFDRAGVPVTILERDVTQAFDDAEEAFRAERRGAPQAHQTHGFLGRVLKVLEEQHPGVLDDLMAAGASRMSMTSALGPAQAGDEDLEVLVVRRTTFENILRRRVEASTGISVRSANVSGLVSHGCDDSGRAVISGVRFDDGTIAEANVVLAATGARSDVPAWLASIGVQCPEEKRPSGLIYLTRWYRRSDPNAPWEPRLFGHLPYAKVLGVPGDGGSLSVTLAIPSGDGELRSLLLNPQRFDQACRLIPTLDQFFAPDAPPLEPLTSVQPMGGLQNRRRRFTDELGRPTVLGFHALGDAHTITNPILGRGCTLAAVQASLLVSAHLAHGGDPVGRSIAYEAACRADVDPWFENAVIMELLEQDSEELQEMAGPDLDGARFVGAMFVLGADDPLLGRALARYVNLLRTPVQLMSNPALMARVAELAEAPGAFEITPAPGPTRAHLIERLNHPDDEHGAKKAGNTRGARATSFSIAEPTPLTSESWPGTTIHPSSTTRQLVLHGIEIHVVEAGPPDGIPVLLVHGFPELAYSWRNQLPQLADAGYRVIAIDQRGFGRSGSPETVDAYDIHALTGDILGVLDGLGIEQAALIAHDWGTVIADTFTLLHPERVLGLMGMSLSLMGRLDRSILAWVDDALTGAFNYIRYFQQPGVAESELNSNVAEMMLRGLAGPIQKDHEPYLEAPDHSVGLVPRLPRPASLPHWLNQTELDHFICEFARTGFTGGINWYRNLDWNWESTDHLDGSQLTVPTAFVTGQYDIMNVIFPPELMAAHVTDHRFDVVLPDVGHWIQQEAPTEVTALILRFLAEVTAPRTASPGL